MAHSSLAIGWRWRSKWQRCVELESISWPRLIIHRAVLWWLLLRWGQAGAAKGKTKTFPSKAELTPLGIYRKLWKKIWCLKRRKNRSPAAVSSVCCKWIAVWQLYVPKWLYLMQWKIWFKRAGSCMVDRIVQLFKNTSTQRVLAATGRHCFEICNYCNCDFNKWASNTLFNGKNTGCVTHGESPKSIRRQSLDSKAFG